MLQTWQQVLYSLPVAGPSISNTTTALSMLSTASPKLTLPNSFFQAPGQVLRIKGCADVSNIVTTPGTLTIDVRMGATVVFSSGAMQLSTTAHTTLPLWFEILLTLRAIGTAGNFIGQGIATSQALSLTATSDSATTPATLLMPNTTPAVGSNFDTTSTQLVDSFATFSIANAANLIQLQQLIIESVN